MLSLRRRKDINRAFQEGVRVYSPRAVLHARRRGEEEGVPGTARLAIVTGRRFPNAVARNRARRLLRETSRVVLSGLGAPWDLVLVARTEVLASSFPERLTLLRELFEKAGILAKGGCCVEPTG